MKKILVVDDYKDLRETMISFVELLGYEVIAASDGQEAKEIIEKTPDIDVVLTDVQMPRLNGIELARYIELNHSRIKTIVMSGDRQEVIEPVVLAAGAEAFLPKPFDLDLLVSKVKKLLGE